MAGYFASVDAGEFYLQLARPEWAPPAWLFGPVWTLLYVMMAVSSWLIWRLGRNTNVYIGLALFVLQLGVNALWTWLFFAWRKGGLAFAEILVLWVLLAATISFFWPLRRLAAVLLLPYLAWITFAAMLNLSVWLRNPVVLS
ncbi:MAG: TspO/MBR family protein [Pseudomonadota bacterium]